MIQILFVCLGNICRSPISEATFRAAVQRRGLSQVISCDSAGTHEYHIGDLPDNRTRQNARQHGLELTHRCRSLQLSDFQTFDYIVAMDKSNLANIQAMSQQKLGHPQPEDRCFLLRKFDPEPGANLSVPDPFYGQAEDFEAVYQIVYRCNEAFLDFLEKEITQKP
jgi:protein-tyrosine phosphatase